MLASGCSTPAPVSLPRGAWGHPNAGRLFGGRSLRNASAGYRLARPNDSARYGTPPWVTALDDALKKSSRRPAAWRVGDLSNRFGGRHERHGSHQNGRDVDVLFPWRDASGQPRHLARAHALSRQGRAIGETRALFDARRAWRLVRELLNQRGIELQWVFLSDTARRLVLRAAITTETDPETLFRAIWVLHQPSYGNPHRDHFHIRIRCSTVDSTAGCIDGSPNWPWFAPHPFAWTRIAKARTPGSGDAERAQRSQ